MDGYTDLGLDGEQAQPKTIFSPRADQEENMTCVSDHAEAAQDRPVTPPPTGPTDEFPRVTDKEKAENWQFCTSNKGKICLRGEWGSAILHTDEVTHILDGTNMMEHRAIHAFAAWISAQLSPKIRILPINKLYETHHKKPTRRTKWNAFMKDLRFNAKDIKEKGSIDELWIPVEQEELWSLLVLNIKEKTARLTILQPVHTSVSNKLKAYVEVWVNGVWKSWIGDRQKKVQNWVVDVIETTEGTAKPKDSGLWLCLSLYTRSTGADCTIRKGQMMEWRHFVAAKARQGAYIILAAKQPKDMKGKK